MFILGSGSLGGRQRGWSPTKYSFTATAVRKPVPNTFYIALFKGSMGNDDTFDRVLFVREYTAGPEHHNPGSKRRVFVVDDKNGHSTEFEAYTFQGRWSYGSGADPLTLYPDNSTPHIKQ